MTEQETRTTILQLLKKIAPDADPSQLKPDDDIRRTLEIDSFDALRFVVAIDETFHIQTPEEDYGKITTVRNLVAYVMRRVDS